MRAFSVICAAAVASAADAFSVPQVLADADYYYTEFKPQGFERTEFVFGMHYGFFKNFIKVYRHYDCKSMMFNWGYETYSMYAWLNKDLNTDDDLEEIIYMSVSWLY